MVPPSLNGVYLDGNSQVLWEDGDRVFCRVWRLGDDGNPSAVLVILPAAERPSPSGLDRLAHEYGLKDELDGAWAVQPLEWCATSSRVQMIETGCAKGPGTLGARKETTGPSSESYYPIEQLDISKRLPILCSPPTESLSRSSGHTSI